jgi:hypothetical protein
MESQAMPAGSGGSKPGALGPSEPANWRVMAFTVGAAVGVLTAVAILVSVHHLFDVLGGGSLPSEDHSFQWGAAFGGLAAAIAVTAVLLALGSIRTRGGLRDRPGSGSG